jgi:two-component system cell cycle response regulator
MRVLAADDDADVRLLLELALSADPATVVTLASSGAEALERAASESYDVIVLDGLMPGMDGAETCRRLKDDPKTAMVPVIFLTALTSAESRDVLRTAGAAGFITKPFDPFRLLEEVRLVLGR